MGNSSDFAVFMILLKSYLGTGLLAIPYAVECGGLWSATIGLAVLATASNFTMKMLIRLKRHVEADRIQSSKEPLLGEDSDETDALLDSGEGPLTFMDLGEFAMGSSGRIAAKAAMLTTNIGISVGYLMFVANTLADAIQGNHTEKPLVDEVVGSIKFNLMTIIVLPVLILLCQIRDIQKLSFSSLLGNFSLGLAIVMVLVYAEGEIVPHTHYPFLELATFPLFFGIAVFSFAMHGVILSIDESALNKERLPVIMNYTVVLVVAMYLTFGAVGYAGYRALIEQSILANLPINVPVRMLEALLCLAIILSIPIFLFPVFETFESNLFPAQPADDDSVQDGVDMDDVVEESESDKPTGVNEVKRSLFRAAVVLMITCFAVMLGPLFADVLSLVGSFSMSFMAFILPCTFAITGMGKTLSKLDYVSCVALGVFGMGGMCVASTVSVIQIIGYFRDPHSPAQCIHNITAP